MSPERIHEALNLLDEDMIQAVEQLRGRKRTLHWPRWAALAACLAVVCMLGLYQFGLLDPAESADTAAGREQTAELATISGDKQEDSEAQNEQEDDTPSDVVEENSVDQSGLTVEEPSVLVRIDSWQENGFAGTVWGTLDTDVYSVGTQVTVVFQADIQLAVEENGTTSYRKLAFGEQPFSEGSVVRVMFTGYADNASQGTETTRTVLHVRQIAPAE